MISKRTNSEIGSVHWFNTIVGSFLHMGEFLSKKNIDDATLRNWGKQMYDDSVELINHFDELTGNKVNISFNGTDIDNKQEFAKAMGQMISKAIEMSNKE